ncbi:type I methionyl aminopeptidase [Buchnera aphidicola]|uniref:Methionine aminopeptidase n=1 Tax=Buchnera aphidicola (Stegophylla sp.) TaxID=2315800 RepID=A0A4D6YB59_9GAMM|nr:type I methionyl aminopeptidase [Buchnera aphidicola (Stegophylla sp.)]QCI26332.1 type I methionyl aminopeptidase [Buchnera aphidicola (Stegophylla sp.)]
MNIVIKNKNDIEKMKISGYLASEVLDMIKPYLVPDITTLELNNICHDYIKNKQKAIPGCLGYQGFPKSVCISVNNVVCHGIPNHQEKLKKGDIVNIDVTIIKDKYYADTSKMFIIHPCKKKEAKKLCYAAQQSLYSTFKIIKPGIPINLIGKEIQKYINTTPYSIVEEYCGHGIGKNFHEKPYILHYLNNYKKIILQEGMIFTIEPIINLGEKHVFCMQDGWTIKTKDNSLSAQYEHTILVTKDGCEILTLRKKEKINRIYKNI